MKVLRLIIGVTTGKLRNEDIRRELEVKEDSFGGLDTAKEWKKGDIQEILGIETTGFSLPGVW